MSAAYDFWSSDFWSRLNFGQVQTDAQVCSKINNSPYRSIKRQLPLLRSCKLPKNDFVELKTMKSTSQWPAVHINATQWRLSIQWPVHNGSLWKVLHYYAVVPWQSAIPTGVLCIVDKMEYRSRSKAGGSN